MAEYFHDDFELICTRCGEIDQYKTKFICETELSCLENKVTIPVNTYSFSTIVAICKCCNYSAPIKTWNKGESKLDFINMPWI